MQTAQSVTTASGNRQPQRWRDGFAALFLVAATVIAYWPALYGNFIWDDNDHISANPTLRSAHGLWQIWFQPGATCQYYPLTFTAFWAGYQLWGLNPLGYHLLDLSLHCLAALLLWQLLARLRVKGAWLAGAIFALHPVCVMTAAWMTEVKNTLSAALALGAAWAYLRFAGLGAYAKEDGGNIQHPTLNTQPPTSSPTTGGTPGKPMNGWWFYALSLALFQLALLAKTAVSFLPVSLLLVAWWQQGKLRWRTLWRLVPMFALAGAMGWLTFHIEHLHGAAGRPFHLGFPERLLVSGRSFWFYLEKLFFPFQLTFIYERWQVDPRAAWQYLFPAAAAAVLAGLWWYRRRIGRAPFAAMAHFFVCTSLLILLVVLYMTRYTFVSDHWQYFGCMSVMALVAAGIASGLERLGAWQLILKPIVIAALLLALGALTWRQCGMYADLQTLWQTTLARNPRCFLAHNNLGELLAQRGTLDEAAAHFQEAIQIQPDFAEARYNYGNILVLEGRLDDAAGQFQKVLEIQPDYAEAHNNLGNILLQKRQVDAAMDHFEIALKIQPDFPEAHCNLGKALLAKGKGPEALAQCRAAADLRPDDPDVLSVLAWVLATSPDTSVRNASGSLDLAQRANELTGGRNPRILQSLGAAYAENGEFAKAAATVRLALQLIAPPSDPRLAGALRSQLKLYERGQPFRESNRQNATPGTGR